MTKAPFDRRLGFRTPTLLVSPFARSGHVSHTRYDHTSVLRMIEWRWGLSPLTVRDATANNLALELNFHAPRTAPPPVYSVPDVMRVVCPVAPTDIVTPTASTSHASRAHWPKLADVARPHGWG